MKIAYLFDQTVELDARAQKEIAAFEKHGREITVYEWNKDTNYPEQTRTLRIRGMDIPCVTNGIRVKKNQGFRSNIFSLVRFEVQLFRWLLKNAKGFDLIYSVNLVTAYVCYLNAKLNKTPYVYDVFDDYADSHQCGPKLYRAIKRIDYRVMKRAKKVVLCSEKRKQQIIRPLNNTEVIYNAPDISAEPDKRCNETFTIVYVGNLKENRMIEDLLEIVSKHPGWRMEIGGDGVLRDLVQQYAAQYSNISYHGILAYENVIWLEQRGDVIPALYDPQVRNNVFAAPNKVFEAMSLGKPTVMVRNTGMDDLVERERTGLVISCNKDSLEKALTDIFNNLQLWRKEAQRIIRLYEERYSWEKMEKKLIEVLL